MTILQPADAAEAREMIGWAAGEKQPLEIVAGGSKRALGRVARPDHTLDVSKLNGIIEYEPAELVLTAKAATPLALIQEKLRAANQTLTFEPPDWRGLLGGNGEPTLGGMLACNLAGPRRVRAGAARDFFLGFAAINGRGENWKGGGKVVKNVTGYDMCKLQAGAYGTLSLLTEVSIKVMPEPETAVTLLFPALADAVAIPLLAKALNTPFEVSAAAHLPQAVARRSALANVFGPLGAVTAIRLEGPAPSVAFRADTVAALLGGSQRLDAEGTARFWKEVGNVTPLLDPKDRCVWRLCPTPGNAAALVATLGRRFASAEAYYDWGGGLVWLALDQAEAGPDGGAAMVREAMKASGGYATLIVAPDALRRNAPVFDPQPATLAALAKRIKNGFDPYDILNPGRMQEGL